MRDRDENQKERDRDETERGPAKIRKGVCVLHTMANIQNSPSSYVLRMGKGFI